MRMCSSAQGECWVWHGQAIYNIYAKPRDRRSKVGLRLHDQVEALGTTVSHLVHSKRMPVLKSLSSAIQREKGPASQKLR